MGTHLQERVAAGTAFMDRLLPDGWQKTINLDTLNIADDENCVLGQCYGSFGTVTNRFDLSPRQARSLGFFENPGPRHGRRYRRLTAAWRQSLQESRELVSA